LLRLAAKRAHKKEKSDAKKARKENAVLHRRMTKNSEKYSKNKDRNAARDLQGERAKIRRSAEDQFKKLTGARFEGLGRPVLPEGVEVPEGEENFFALLDLTDEEVKKRLAKKKTAKRDAARKLRRQQMEMKKLNRALKARRKECENKGMVFDVQVATKEILDAQGGKDDEEDEEWEDQSENGEGEGGEPTVATSKRSAEDEITEEPKPKKKKKNPPNIPKINMTLLDPASVTSRIAKEKKKTRRYLKKIDAVAISLETGEELGPPKKKEKKAKAVGEVEEGEKKQKEEKREEKKKKKAERAEKAEQEDEKERKEQKKEEKKRKKAAKEEEKEVEAVTLSKEDKGSSKKKKKTEETEENVEAVPAPKEKSLKKKKKDVEEEIEAVPAPKEKSSKKKKKTEEAEEDIEAAPTVKEKSSKKRKHKSSEDVETPTEDGVVAAQWNPDALSGDAERKTKFLRLLGGGKAAVAGDSNGVSVVGGGKKSKKGEIEKVQGELERQYEMGMKMKHDGGGKRRGLGA
jgi:hypothetical protein